MKIEFDKSAHRCANCNFFDEFPEQKRDDNILGSCKANPPSIPSESSTSRLGVFPMVLGYDYWCGLFSSKFE